MVKANVDRILEVLRQKKSTSISDLSKILKLKKEDIQKSAEYLEQDAVIKIEHKWPKVMLTLIESQNNMPTPPPLKEPKKTPQVSPSQNKIQPQSQSQVQNIQPPVQVQSTSQPQQMPVSPINQEKKLPETSVQPQNQPGKVSDVLQQMKPLEQKPVPHQNLQPNTSSVNLVPIENNNKVAPGVFQQPDMTKKVSTSTHKNLPPPPIPKHKSSQTSTNNYSGQTMQETLKSEQDNSQIEKPQPQDFGSFNQEDDPLNPEKPQFNLPVPSPGDEEITPIFSNSTEFSSKTIEVPSHLENDMEKIEFLIDKIKTKIENHEYEDINDFYRKIHSLYMDSENISPNERYLISQKINDVFERIKHLYTLDEIT